MYRHWWQHAIINDAVDHSLWLQLSHLVMHGHHVAQRGGRGQQRLWFGRRDAAGRADACGPEPCAGATPCGKVRHVLIWPDLRQSARHVVPPKIIVHAHLVTATSFLVPGGHLWLHTTSLKMAAFRRRPPRSLARSRARFRTNAGPKICGWFVIRGTGRCGGCSTGEWLGGIRNAGVLVGVVGHQQNRVRGRGRGSRKAGRGDQVG
mmetsp:Transcript_17029/g.47146  ORF Transcript_17029/g.47146 Transcript_17029/m.47146 type:complete len:206 (+) Transcript_17029:2248-2865(+)